jgi:flagellar motor switch protein FliN
MNSTKENAMTTIANDIELEPLAEHEDDGKPVLGSVLPSLGSVKVRVAVRVGSTETSVAGLLEMKQGAVLELDRLVDEPLDVLVDQHVVARGVLVAVGEHFGVRITEAATAALPAPKGLTSADSSARSDAGP